MRWVLPWSEMEHGLQLRRGSAKSARVGDYEVMGACPGASMPLMSETIRLEASASAEIIREGDIPYYPGADELNGLSEASAGYVGDAPAQRLTKDLPSVLCGDESIVRSTLAASLSGAFKGLSVGRWSQLAASPSVAGTEPGPSRRLSDVVVHDDRRRVEE